VQWASNALFNPPFSFAYDLRVSTLFNKLIHPLISILNEGGDGPVPGFATDFTRVFSNACIIRHLLGKYTPVVTLYSS
jgi:hypothetical protein